MTGPVDVMGVPIEVGDTVAYSVNTRHGGLQIGIVKELLPYQARRSVPNPRFDYNQPSTWGDDSPNPRSVYKDVIEYKIKFKEPDQHAEDQYHNPVVYPGRTKTLDNPGRFAVVRKYDPNRREIVRQTLRGNSTYV